MLEWLADRYRKRIKINEAIATSLSWRPTLHFETSESVIVAAEVMSTPFPEILQVTKLNIVIEHLPITVYSICPQAAFLTNDGQKQARALRAHGFGLFTVDENGLVTEQFGAIPLIQHIPIAELEDLLDDMPPWLRTKVREAFKSYCTKATNGITEISDILETMVNNAVKRAIGKGWLKSNCRNLMLADSLDAMAAATQFDAARAAIGGARAFVKDYRNFFNHAARSPRKAYTKFRKCKMGFFAGINVLETFYAAMKSLGISVR